MKSSLPLLSPWFSSLLACFGFNSFTKQPLDQKKIRYFFAPIAKAIFQSAKTSEFKFNQTNFETFCTGLVLNSGNFYNRADIENHDLDWLRIISFVSNQSNRLIIQRNDTFHLPIDLDENEELIFTSNGVIPFYSRFPAIIFIFTSRRVIVTNARNMIQAVNTYSEVTIENSSFEGFIDFLTIGSRRFASPVCGRYPIRLFLKSIMK